jgi:hypothetical protein
MSTIAALYESDYQVWLDANIDLLRQSRFQELDVEHLIEEMADMGKKDRAELANRLVVLIAHLLKWQYQPAHRSSGWRGSIVEQRVQIQRNLRQSPSLKNYLNQAIEDAYPDALEIATQETGLSVSTFPVSSSYRPEQLLDKEFWPDAD